MDMRELSKKLGDAINVAIRNSDAVSDAVAELHATGHVVSEVVLQMSVSQTPVCYPVPIEPSVAWLDRIYSLQDRRS